MWCLPGACSRKSFSPFNLFNADIQVFSFIIVAQRTPPNQQMQGGLSPSTVPRRDIGQAVKNLTNQEFAYENFWRLLAQIQCQWPGWWDSANHWAMKKLGVYDELDQERKYHYGHITLEKIKEDTGKYFGSNGVELIIASFHQQRNARLAEEKRNAYRAIQARATIIDRSMLIGNPGSTRRSRSNTISPIATSRLSPPYENHLLNTWKESTQ
jgi:hypothetical protein